MFGRIGTTIRPCLLNGSYQCVPDRDMDCITDGQVMDFSFRSLLSTGILPMLIIIPLHCYLLWVGMHTVTLTYSPLLGGCYVYDGCVNLLHT